MISYDTFELPNGLRVAHHYDPTSAMVAMNIIYNTGARDESRKRTGIAHLFEHLMFGGSPNVPDYDGEMNRAGGMNNAWTSNDFTSFYDVVPAVNVETAFFLESDRMNALSFRPEALRAQRSVVVEEFKQQCLNQPYGDLFHHLRAALYAPEHPYSWPVIGLLPEHIESVTDEETRRWFYEHYAPNNAVMALAGNITAERARELTQKWFGHIERRHIAPRHLPDPGFPTADRTVDIHGSVPMTVVVVAIPMGVFGTPEFYAADVITDILSAGWSGRIPQRLVVHGDGLIAAADASILGSEHEGFLMMTAQLTDNSPEAAARAREQLLEQGRQLAVPGDVSPRELQRCFNRFEANYTLENMSCQAKARTLAEALIHNYDPNLAIRRHHSVTAEAISHEARRLFLETPVVTVNYYPENPA